MFAAISSFFSPPTSVTTTPTSEEPWLLLADELAKRLSETKEPEESWILVANDRMEQEEWFLVEASPQGAVCRRSPFPNIKTVTPLPSCLRQDRLVKRVQICSAPLVVEYEASQSEVLGKLSEDGLGRVRQFFHSQLGRAKETFDVQEYLTAVKREQRENKTKPTTKPQLTEIQALKATVDAFSTSKCDNCRL